MKQGLLIIAAALLVLSAPAFAGFSLVKPPSAPRAPLAPVGPMGASPPLAMGLIETRFIGEPDGTIEIRHGFGRDTTIADALKQIAPAGWHARLQPAFADQFDRNKRVSWHGGRPWTSVLDILANEQGFSVDIDWARKVLVVGAPLPVPTLAAVSVSHTLSPAPAPPPPPPPAPWVAKLGVTMESVVTSWSDRAGWTTSWEYRPTFKIDPALQFPGTYSYTEAVTRFVAAYADASDPPHACLYPGMKPKPLIRIVPKSLGCDH